MTTDRITRRACLLASAVPALGAIAPEALAEVLAEGAQKRRPLLRQRSLNRVIGRPSAPDYLDTLKACRQEGLYRFLDTRFALTDQQKQEIRSIPRADLDALNGLLTRAIAANVPVRVEIIQLEGNADRTEIMRRFGLEPAGFKKLTGVTTPEETLALRITI